MDFSIDQATQYVVIAGSHSYGMATPESDIDVRGWCTPTKEYYFSYHKNFEQHDSKYFLQVFPWKNELEKYFGKRHWSAFCSKNEYIDSVIYSIKKFVALAAKCNPNIIELLFVDEADILYATELGRLLRNNRNLFLSAKAFYTYTGYAVSQLKRINTHRKWLLNPPKKPPIRKEYGLPEKTIIPKDQLAAAEKLINKQVRLWLLEEAEVDKTLVQTIQGDIQDAVASITGATNFEESVRQAAAHRLGMSSNFVDILQRERRYRQDRNNWKQYQHWLESRSPARAKLEQQYGYDTKHASHLVRLVLQAEEILTKGTLTVKDKERARRLLSVRQGTMNYDDLMLFASVVMEHLESIYKNKEYVVPHKPNVPAIDNLAIRIVEQSLDYNS